MSKKDKWHNATLYAKSDQAMLLVGQGKEPIALEMLNGVCVWVKEAS